MDSCHVLLNESEMVSPKQWAQAVKDLGFGLELDAAFEREDDKDDGFGYRPCEHYGQEVGFELSYTRRQDDPEWFEGWNEYYEEADKYDFCVSLGFGEDTECVLIAGAVLASITNGVYMDVDSPLELEDAMALAFEADKNKKAEAGLS